MAFHHQTVGFLCCCQVRECKETAGLFASDIFHLAHYYGNTQSQLRIAIPQNSKKDKSRQTKNKEVFHRKLPSRRRSILTINHRLPSCLMERRRRKFPSSLHSVHSFCSALLSFINPNTISFKLAKTMMISKSCFALSLFAVSASAFTPMSRQSTATKVAVPRKAIALDWEQQSQDDYDALLLSRAMDCAGSDTCSLEEAEQYLESILHAESGCASGALIGNQICDNVIDAAEAVANLREKVVRESRKLL